MDFIIRSETLSDIKDIRRVTELAFAAAKRSSGTEGAIIDALRTAKALSISLVAIKNGEVVGHIAFSPVTIGGADEGWFGLGPVSVHPDLHGQGIGKALIQKGLEQLRADGAKGCVVLGDPNYYVRFGFAHTSAIWLHGVPPQFFMMMSFGSKEPAGAVAYHQSFTAS